MDRGDEEVDQEQEGEEHAGGDPLFRAHHHPEPDDDDGQPRGEQFRGGEQDVAEVRRLEFRLESLLQRYLYPFDREFLGAVRSHLGHGVDRLAHHSQRVGHPVSHPVVAAPQHPLEPQEDHCVGGDADEDDERQAPLIGRHHRQGHGHLGAVDEEHDPAPLHELLERREVAGDPGDQRPPPLGLHVEDRPAHQVGEDLHPQLRQPGRSLLDEAHQADPGEHAADNRHREADPGGGQHSADVHSAFAHDVTVEGQLDDHRDQDLGCRPAEIEHQHEPDAAAEDRRLSDGASQRSHRRQVGDRRGHDRSPERAAASCSYAWTSRA